MARVISAMAPSTSPSSARGQTAIVVGVAIGRTGSDGLVQPLKRRGEFPGAQQRHPEVVEQKGVRGPQRERSPVVRRGAWVLTQVRQRVAAVMVRFRVSSTALDLLAESVDLSLQVFSCQPGASCHGEVLCAGPPGAGKPKPPISGRRENRSIAAAVHAEYTRREPSRPQKC